MPESPPDFSAILAALNAAGVRFVLIGGLLIGGLAMIAHGSNHITQDIDLLYARDPSNVEALMEALAASRPRLRGVPDEVPFLFDPLTFRNMINFTLETTLGAVDLLGAAAGADSFEGLWNRGMTMELYGVPVRVASLDDLIAMKRAAGRPKDQAHLLELLALRKLIQEEHSCE